MPNTSLPVTGVVPISQIMGDEEEDTRLLQEMSEEAQMYLSSFAWCNAIDEFYFGEGVGGVFAVFFARIKPKRPDVDEWLWVIVGDVPPAYLVTDVCRTPKEAAEAYIEQMRKWVAAARLSQTSKDIIPVNVPATPEWAETLHTRLNTLEFEVIPKWFIS
jgi:hypothetical protein